MIKVSEWERKAGGQVAAMDEAHINYHVGMTPGETVAYLQGLRNYNCFDTTKAVQLIREIVSIAPPVPHREGPDVEFVVGREGSQVIYACVSTSGNKLRDDFQFQGWFIQQMERIGSAADVDESDHRTNHPLWGHGVTHFCWRFWWD